MLSRNKDLNQEPRKALHLAAGVLALCASCAPSAFGQPAPIPQHAMPYSATSACHDGTGREYAVVEVAQITVPAAPWLRLHFGDCQLGRGTFISVRGLQDGGTQILDATSLEQWGCWSAYFDGDAVEVQLHVAPNDHGARVELVEVLVGDRLKGWRGERTLCGDDDRVASSDPAVGRLLNASLGSGCTGWIVSNGAQLSAGHCVDSALHVLQFRVPASLCDGTIQHPGPEDQYSVDRSRVVSTDDGLGNDWAVWACYPNPNTGLLPVEAQGEFYRMSRDDNPSDVRITGYGTDSTPPGCEGGANAQNKTEQTDVGPLLGETVQEPSRVYFEYRADTMPANSGSPIIVPDTTLTLGIHTRGGCTQSGGSNSGTGFENDSLEAAVGAFPGPVVRYIDQGHPCSTKDGTIFRPYATVIQGVNALPAGGLLAIVTGDYSETMTINKAMTITAPVGPVTIGATK